MSQFIRPSSAYGAQTATVSTLSSVGIVDHGSLHKRITDVIGLKRGTTQYGTIRSFNTSERHIEIPDLVYSNLVSSGVNFLSELRNDPNSPGTLTNTSEIPPLWNPGLHKQIVMMVGDSITNSGVGSGTHAELTILTNKLWAQPVAQSVNTRNSFILNPIQYCPDRGHTCQWTHPISRIVYNYGVDSWRIANQSGFTYTLGSPWINNIAHMNSLSLHPTQQLVCVIFCGTNDVAYGDDNGNPGLSAVPLGTPGATYAGNINYITGCLIPFINSYKSLYPNAKIVFVTPIARDSTGTLNPKFNEIADYTIANRASLGIDIVVDTRTIPEFDCRNPSVTLNTSIYQSDRVHIRAAGNILLGTSINTALNSLLS